MYLYLDKSVKVLERKACQLGSHQSPTLGQSKSN